MLAMCGIKFFYTFTLQRDCPTLKLVRAAHERKLPVVLSQEEVCRVLGTVRIRQLADTVHYLLLWLETD